MLTYIQWARRNPQDYAPIGSEGWATSPVKADPSRGTPYALNEITNSPGWVADLSVQGISFSTDHYHVRDLTDGSSGIVITAWNDKPPFSPPGNRFARVVTILPLAPDSKLGGALNTRQSQVVYAEGSRYDAMLANPIENTVVSPWSDFVAPTASEVRHGIWLTDAAWDAHVAVRTTHGFREWAV